MNAIKFLRTAFFPGLLLAIGRHVSGQSFINLGFEIAYITPDPSSPYYPNAVYASNAIRGWTASGFISPDILYNSISLGATSVSLIGPDGPLPALAGNYSIDLYSGSEGPATGASISQTGLVPANAASIRFIAQGPGAGVYGAGPLLVSLGGQNIPITALSTGPNYTTYGGDVSAFAGQVEELMFDTPQSTANNNYGNNYWEIDSIQFSSNPIPEPSTWTLLLCGAGLFVRRYSSWGSKD